SKNQDVFTNPTQIDYNTVAFPTGPSSCDSSGTNNTLFSTPTDSNENAVNVNGNERMCIPNAFYVYGDQLTAHVCSDGLKDGFVDPVRIYKSMEFEVNKSFSKNWQLRANYRIAKLF